MSRKGCPWSYLVLVRIFEMKRMVLIYTRRGLGYGRGIMFYPWIEMDEAGTQDVTILLVTLLLIDKYLEILFELLIYLLYLFICLRVC